MVEENHRLIAEQLQHMLDLERARVNLLDRELAHYKEFTDHRLRSLEEKASDQETRLRAATEGVTQFKVVSGLASGGGFITAVLALIKSFMA